MSSTASTILLISLPNPDLVLLSLTQQTKKQTLTSLNSHLLPISFSSHRRRARPVVPFPPNPDLLTQLSSPSVRLSLTVTSLTSLHSQRCSAPSVRLSRTSRPHGHGPHLTHKPHTAQLLRFTPGLLSPSRPTALPSRGSRPALLCASPSRPTPPRSRTHGLTPWHSLAAKACPNFFSLFLFTCISS
ncbi:hypothetical protein Syun_018362 [Stephania yunnanensis]|uniref:Uncharacterized protein n=1 Tax=Stephania yunnanensis TaxID=152371 RepID=A0AAP0NWY9_9MAGN